MARIRSIKPEFWTDATVTDLSAECALFFVALWNFATDQGVFENDSRALSLLIPRYRSQVIKHMLSSLWKAGLIARSEDAQLWLVTGWAHQKIDRPKAGKWNPNEIKWVTFSESPNDRDSSSNVRRKDRIGSDRIGSDRIVSRQVPSAPPDPPENLVKPEQEKNRETWEAYQEAYKARYGEPPVRNAKVNSQIAQLVKRLGDEAPDVARFYLTHNKQFYVQNLHSLNLLLANAESLRTQWATGTKVTGIQARQQEIRDNNVDAMKTYLASKGGA